MSEQEDYSAIENAISDVCGGMLTGRWIVAAEVLAEGGERELHSIIPQDMKVWDALGLSEHTREIIRQNIVSN